LIEFFNIIGPEIFPAYAILFHSLQGISEIGSTVLVKPVVKDSAVVVDEKFAEFCPALRILDLHCGLISVGHGTPGTTAEIALIFNQASPLAEIHSVYQWCRFRPILVIPVIKRAGWVVG
jgi:hypothetical protein